MTRALPVAVKVSRHPLLERHGALHVGRLVLNVSKYLIRLPNARGKDHQRVRAREGESGFACCADDSPIGGCDSKEVANGCHCAGKPLRVKAAARRGLLKPARSVLNRAGSPARTAYH